MKSPNRPGSQSSPLEAKAASRSLDLNDIVGLPTVRDRWLAVRAPIGAVALGLGLILGLLLDWTGALPVAVLGGLLLIDVALRRRGVLTSTASAVVVDTTLMSVAILELRPPGAVVAMPYAYLLSTTFLLLPWHRAMPLVGYQIAWMSFLLIGPTIGWWTTTHGTEAAGTAAVMASVFVITLISIFGHAGKALAEVRRTLTRRYLYEQSVSACSRALLQADDDSALQRALEILLDGTSALSVFVERNVEHQELGLCSTLVAEALRPETEPDPDEHWALVPWSKMPSAFEHLSRGEPFAFTVDDLEGDEHDLYAESGVESELDIPIQIGGTWVGLIGFSDLEIDLVQRQADVDLLRSAAEMIGVFWERNQNRQDLERAFARLDHRFNLEHALARSARALLSDMEDPVMTALEELIAATRSDFVFVDENFEDTERGLCTRITHRVADRSVQDANQADQLWSGAYSEIPTAFEDLSRGRPSMIVTSQLDGEERRIYEADGVLSELSIPINANGEWRGSISFIDYQIERRWTSSDIEFLQTAAELIGAYWEREESKARLESAVDSLDVRARYEESLAHCSQELLTDDPDALDRAFVHLIKGTGVDYVWLEENFDDPDEGFSARIVTDAETSDPARNVPHEGWYGGPHTNTPTSFDRLSRGEASIIQITDLSGDELELYEVDGLQSELMLPLHVFGEWYGSVGFADYHSPREWPEQDIQVLRTAAQMISSFLERRGARARLEQLIRSKDEFIASVSHELRTPLTSVLGFTEVLLSGYGDLAGEEREELLGLIGREAQEVAWIVEDLLAFARADIGTLAATVVDTSMVEQVQAVLAGQSAKLVSRVTVVGDTERVLADPGRVRQIVRNLITNAFRYGGPNVIVRVERAGDSIRTHVIDDGDGIPEDQRSLIFDAYHTAHEQGGQPGSVGLGLNVARKLAKVMGGDLTYSYADGCSAFQLSLPIASEIVAAAV